MEKENSAATIETMGNEHGAEEMSRFIAQRRKQQNMTQKDLADTLGVTDKAVSKWETGASCPDIALLIPLARCLHCSVSELLGEQTEAPEAEAVVEKAVRYSHKSAAERWETLRRILMAAFSAACLLAVSICFICDIAISKGHLSWSLIVALSVALGWLLVAPFLALAKKRIRGFLLVLTVAVPLYFVPMSALLHAPHVFWAGISISAVALLCLWAIYAICVRLRAKPWRASGFSLLCLIPAVCCFNFLGDYFSASSRSFPLQQLLNGVILAGLAALCFCIDVSVAGKTKKKNTSL